MKQQIIFGIIVMILIFVFCGKNKGADPVPGNDPVTVEEKYKNVKVDIIKELYDE